MPSRLFDPTSALFLDNRSPEWISLSRETDPAIRREGLRLLGQRAERENNLELAVQIFLAMGERHRLDRLSGKGPVGPRAEFLLRRLGREAVHPASLLGLTAASAVFGMTRLAAWARWGRINGWAGRVSAELLAFSAEAATFPLVTRSVAGFFGDSMGGHEANLGAEIASSFIFLGALRFARGAAWVAWHRLRRPGAEVNAIGDAVISPAAMLGGILGGQVLEEEMGLRPHQEVTTRLVDSLALLLQFGIAGRLARQLTGIGCRQWGEKFNRDFRLPLPRLMAAAGEGLAVGPSPRIPTLLWMTGNRGDGNSGDPPGSGRPPRSQPPDNVIPIERARRRRHRTRQSGVVILQSPPLPDTLRDLARASDPTSWREPIRDALWKWLPRPSPLEFQWMAGRLERGLDRAPPYFTKFLGYLCLTRPLAAKALMIRLDLIPPRGSLGDPEVQRALADRLGDSLTGEELTDQAYLLRSFQGTHLRRYFPERGELRSAEGEWTARLSGLPRIFLETLKDPYISPAQYLYLVHGLGLDASPFPLQE